MTTRTTTRSGRIGRLAGTAVLALALTGCVSLDADLALNRDAQATGELRISVAKQVASFAGITDLAAFEAQMAQDGEEELPNGASVSYEETDTSYVAVAQLDDVTLDDEDFGAKVVGDTIEFTFVSEGSEDSEFGEMGSITLEVSFPGKLTEVTGAEQVDDDTIKYAGPATRDVEITATSARGSALAGLWLWLGLGGLAVGGAAAVGAALWALRGRRSQTAQTTWTPAGSPAPTTASSEGAPAAADDAQPVGGDLGYYAHSPITAHGEGPPTP